MTTMTMTMALMMTTMSMMMMLMVMEFRPRVDWLWRSYRRILDKLSKERRHVIIIITRPWPAFGRQGLVGSSGGYTYHGYTSHASPRACGARLGRKVSRNGRNVISPIYRQF